MAAAAIAPLCISVADRSDSIGHLGVYDLEVYDKGQGLGSNLMSHITANADEPVHVVEALEQSKPFWDKVGAQGYDQYNNTTVDWQDTARYLAERQGEDQSAGHGLSAEQGGPGVHGLEVGEISKLTPEEAEALGLSPEAKKLKAAGLKGIPADRVEALEVLGELSR